VAESFRVIIPVREPWPISDTLVEGWPSFVAELDGMVLPAPIADGASEPVSLRWLGPDEVPEASVSIATRGNFIEWTYLEGSVTVDPPYERLTRIRDERDSRFDPRIEAQQVVREDLWRFAFDLGIACTIAFPGIYSASRLYTEGPDGQMFSWSESETFHGSGPWEAQDVLGDPAWPRVGRLAVQDVWVWLSGLSGFFDGVPSGPGGRAVSALSHVLQGSNAESLMHALLGLESLYCTSHTGLRQQLISRAELVLGAPSSHKKLFGRVYDYRSKFIHGGSDLPLRYTPYDGSDRFMELHREAHDAQCLATLVLVASIQALVSHSISEFVFREEWVNGGSS